MFRKNLSLARTRPGDFKHAVKPVDFAAFPIGQSLELIPAAYLYAVGDHSIGTSGTPASLIGGYDTYNASLTLQDVDANWNVMLECKNCNDRRMPVSNFVGIYLQDPRTWSLSFRAGFGGG